MVLFAANWISLLVNLLPVMPLDGGQILRAVLSTRAYPEVVHRAALNIGLGVAVLLLCLGVIFDMSQIVLIGTFVLMINVVQLLQEDLGEPMDDSAFGYDFSAGYESLERSNPDNDSEKPNPSLLQLMAERAAVEFGREQQDRIRRMEAEQQLDVLLLAKVHETGLQSLSEQEQKLLRNCSELLRGRSKSNG